MSIIYFLIGCSMLLALLFLLAFFGRIARASTMTCTRPLFASCLTMSPPTNTKSDQGQFHG